MSREQRGYVFHKGSSWFLRYNELVLDNGKFVRKQICRKLPVEYCDEYRKKGSVKPFVDAILGPINNGKANPNSTMSLVDFVGDIVPVPKLDKDGKAMRDRKGRIIPKRDDKGEVMYEYTDVWFPRIKEFVRPYTVRVYHQLWSYHLRPRIDKKLTLRDFRTVHAVDLLSDVGRSQNVSKSTLAHLKHLLSGIFKRAKSWGYLDEINPIQGAELPHTFRETDVSHAYSLAEVQTMLLALENEPTAKTIVLTAALTGLRRSELMGLRICDYNGRELSVVRSVVEGDINLKQKLKAPKLRCR